jgi:uncharacterized protein YqgC (DUF456 family)
MEALGDSLALLVVFVAFGIGLLGSFLPVVPGTLLVWLAVLFYAWPVDGFETFSPWVFALITLVGLVAGTADLWLPLLGAKSTGASWRTLAVGLLGGVLGTFLLPLPIFGTIVGYGAGVLLAEYVRHGAWRPAWRATLGGVVGWGISAAVELVGCIIMILLFFTQA